MSVQWDFDYAVLVQVTEMYKATRSDLMAGEVQQHFPAEQHEDVLESLCRLGGTDGHIEIAFLRKGDGGVHALRIKGVTEKGLRASGAWPASDEQIAQALLAAIDEAADRAPDAQERSKIKAFGSAFAALGTNAGGGIAAAAFAKLMGWM